MSSKSNSADLDAMVMEWENCFMTTKLSLVQERVLNVIERPKRMEDFRQFWSKKYGRELSMGETEEIQGNLTAYFRLLAQWDVEDKARMGEDVRTEV